MVPHLFIRFWVFLNVQRGTTSTTVCTTEIQVCLSKFKGRANGLEWINRGYVMHPYARSSADASSAVSNMLVLRVSKKINRWVALACSAWPVNRYSGLSAEAPTKGSNPNATPHCCEWRSHLSDRFAVSALTQRSCFHQHRAKKNKKKTPEVSEQTLLWIRGTLF